MFYYGPEPPTYPKEMRSLPPAMEGVESTSVSGNLIHIQTPIFLIESVD
jgi:hypothetical protein